MVINPNNSIYSRGGRRPWRVSHRLISPQDNGQKPTLLGYALVGIVASMAFLYVSESWNDAIKLIAQSIAAGYAGKAILSAVGNKIKAAVAQNEAAGNLRLAVKAGNRAYEIANKHVSNLLEGPDKQIDLGKLSEISDTLNALVK